MSNTDCVCGVIDVQYRRSADGKVVHRATCTRLGTKSVEWHYAFTRFGNDHKLVAAEVAAVPWLRACYYCMNAEAQR